VTAVARELDLVPSAVGQWVKQAQTDRSKGRTGLTTAESEELTRLRKENRILQEERKLPRQVDSPRVDFPGDTRLAKKSNGGTPPRLSCGRSPL